MELVFKKNKSMRLRNYDYSRDALYFITTCVKDRNCCFGTVLDGRMKLNGFGKIVGEQWLWLEKQFPFVRLHAYVTMPNHIHGIIEIGRDLVTPESKRRKPIEYSCGIPIDYGKLEAERPVKIKSLSELIGAFKTTSSKRIHLAGLKDFTWQHSFHDSIIRDKNSFFRISKYIRNNPSKWKEDEWFI